MARRRERSFPTARSRTSTRAAGAGCRSTTSRTFATRWRGSTRSYSKTTGPGTGRTRLLRAAKRYGIVPIGFLSSELQPQRRLPTGVVTLLLADVEGSTELLRRLDDRYPPLLAEIRRIIRAAVRKSGGREADARADDFFAVFKQAPAALEASLAVQRKMHRWTSPISAPTSRRLDPSRLPGNPRLVAATPGSAGRSGRGGPGARPRERPGCGRTRRCGGRRSSGEP